MKLEIRVAHVQYEANVVKAARVRSFALSWDADGKLSRRFVKSCSEDACKCCGKSSSIMIALDGSGYICQRCLFAFLAEELHE